MENSNEILKELKEWLQKKHDNIYLGEVRGIITQEVLFGVQVEIKKLEDKYNGKNL